MSVESSQHQRMEKGRSSPTESPTRSRSPYGSPPPSPLTLHAGVGGYNTVGALHQPEDILFCVDMDHQVECEMKPGGTGTKGKIPSRLDAIKQALLLFVHSKLLMHPSHRFAVATITSNFAWHQQEFTNDTDIINSSVRGLSSSGQFDTCDLSKLVSLCQSEAKKSRDRGRTFRVILIYCRSSVVPSCKIEWKPNPQRFTLDAMYLHDKPGPQNCPQRVYDALVDVLEQVSENEGYIFESGGGLSRGLFKHMCILLSHPQQRCSQDDIDVPKNLEKCSTGGDGSTTSRRDEESYHLQHYN